MRKIIFNFMTVLMALILCFGTVGCFGNQNGEDKFKTTLYVGTFDNAFGTEWLQSLKERFERDYAEVPFEPNKKGVVIDCEPNRGLVGMTSFDTFSYDVVFTEQLPYYNFVAANQLVDITDVVTAINESDGGKAIVDKMNTQQQSGFSVDGEYYALPHTSGSMALFYDVDMFVRNSLYFDTNGGFTNGVNSQKSTGPDGEPGTYDDGLPATIAQLKILCEEMSDQGINPINYAGSVNEYVSLWLTTLILNLVPETESELMWSLNGSSSTLIDKINSDGSVTYLPKTDINSENGYMLMRQDGRYEAMKLFQELFEDGRFYSKSQGTYSHVEAQHDFMKGTYSKINKNGSKIGLLIEGTWWETESSSYYEEMVDGGMGEGASRKNRNFAVMPFPKLNESSLGQNIALEWRNSTALIPSRTPEYKIELAKEFLKYCYTDESLNDFTRVTGTTIAVNFKVDEEVKNTLPSYSKSLIEYNANSKVMQPLSQNEYYLKNQPFFTNYVYGWQTKVEGLSFSYPTLFMKSTQIKDKTAKAYLEGVWSYYTKEYWENLFK